MEAKIEVGATVRRNMPQPDEVWIGTIVGTVVAVEPNDEYPITVRFGEDNYVPFKEEELEVIPTEA